jgi:hypothetical protein
MGRGGLGAGEALRLKLNTPLAVASALMDSCLRSLQADLANAQAEVGCDPSLAFRLVHLSTGTGHTKLHGKHMPTKTRRFCGPGSMRITCDTVKWPVAPARGDR